MVINRGRLVTHTTVQELVSETTVRVRSPQIERLEAHVGMAGGVIRARGADAIELTGLTTETIGTMAAAESIVLHELSTRTRTLEDVFLDLTHEGAQP